jgi:hypothetical protein
MKELDDGLDERLRAWAEVPLPAALSARTLTQARAAFESGRAGRWGALATAAAVVSAVATYLAWAVQLLSALARG